MSDPKETVKSNVTNSTHKSLLLRNILFNNKNTNDTLTILMESKGEAPNGEDSTKTKKNDKVKENEVDTEKKGQKHQFDGSLHIEDGAGPSRINLPGSTESPKIHRTGISKSEHSMTKVVTKQDVASALKLTSISFGTNDPNSLNNAKTINFKDIKIPMLEKCDEVVKIDSATLGDLKKFMANCFKLNKESDIPPSSEVGGNLHTVISTVVAPTCVTSNVQTDDTDVVRKHNEVIVTKPNPTVNTAVSPPLSTPLNVSAIDARLPKATTEKEKKKSNSASEKSDIAVTRRDSMSSIGSSVCRICMTRGRERLISPCNCKGSLANVHLSCLERWLNQVGRNHCELCGYSYPAIRTPRYTVLQALRLWFGNPRNRSHLQSDCLIFWLLSTVTAGLLAVCIVGTQYFVIEGNKFGKLEGAARKEGISHRITETAMDFFMAIVLCGYSVTVYLLWKDHYVMWNRWRRANVNVRLLISPDANPVPFVPRTRYTNIV